MSSLWALQLKAAEEIGLGMIEYNIMEVNPDKNDF